MRTLIVGSLLAVLFFPGCSGGSKKDEEDGPPYDLTCTVCVDWEEFNEFGGEYNCREGGASLNQGQPCTLDGQTLDSVVVTFGGCRKEPVCPGEPGEPAFGGAGNLGDWDYECHFCGDDESEVDSAHDGAVESSGCGQSAILRGQGDACEGGGQATVVALSDCDEVPACAQE